MPEHQHETFEKNGHIRTHVTMKRGEAISLCRCWKSKKFPLCDGTHNTLDNDLGPAVITVDCDQSFREGKLTSPLFPPSRRRIR